jgi:hypothetical protein
MEARGRSGGPILTEPTLRMAVGALGIFHVLEGIYMLLAPGSFFHRIGMYGVENTHYVGDIGSFVIAFGIALLLAAGRPSWRTPVLAVGALWYAFHALNHVFDIDEARSTARGVVDTVLLALGALLLAWLADVAQRERRPEPLARVPRAPQ